MEKCRKFWKMDLYGVRGQRPEASEIIKKVKNINGNLQNFANFNEL